MNRAKEDPELMDFYWYWNNKCKKYIPTIILPLSFEVGVDSGLLMACQFIDRKKGIPKVRIVTKLTKGMVRGSCMLTLFSTIHPSWFNPQHDNVERERSLAFDNGNIQKVDFSSYDWDAFNLFHKKEKKKKILKLIAKGLLGGLAAGLLGVLAHKHFQKSDGEDENCAFPGLDDFNFTSHDEESDIEESEDDEDLYDYNEDYSDNNLDEDEIDEDENPYAEGYNKGWNANRFGLKPPKAPWD